MTGNINRTISRHFTREEKRIDKLASMTTAERAAFTKAQWDMLGDLTWEEAMMRASELDTKTDKMLGL